MGENAYAYRGHSNYGNNGSSGTRDQVFRTVIYDSDGTKRTVLGRSPYDSQYSVVETEVSELIRSPLVTDYRNGSLQKVNLVRDYGSYGSYENYRRPTSHPYNDRHPQDLNQFLTDVLVEASWPPHRYTPSNGGAAALHPTNYSIGVTHGYGGWVAPVTTHPPAAASTHGAANSKLSLPTNSIEEGRKNTSNTSEVVNPNSDSRVHTCEPRGYKAPVPKTGSLQIARKAQIQ